MAEKHYIAYRQYCRKEVHGMNISKRLFPGLAALIMLLGVALVIAPPASAGVNPVPALTISLDPSSQEAKVSESAQGAVQFTGSVKVDKLPVERISVVLTSSVDAGWPSQCSPSMMVITDVSAHSFSVTTIVPQATPSNIIGNLKVDAKGQGGGFVCTGAAQVIITVKPYYRVMMESDMPYREISPGTQAFYSFKIWNVGNAIDSYEMEIVNLKDLVNKKWTCTLSATQVAKINPNEYKTVRLTAQSPRDWTIWKSEPTMINVKSSSLNAKEEQAVITQSFQLYAYEKGFYIPGFDPIFLIAAMAMGAVILKKRRR